MSNIDVVQIGANSGLTPEGEDIIWPIIRKNGWKGLFIEPLPEPFKLLVENYSDIEGCEFENCAVMDYNGKVELWYHDQDTRVASVFKSHVREKNTGRIIVPCFTLEYILNEHCMRDQEFELLQIDTEGMDGRILVSTDFTHILPRYIRFEHVHLNKKEEGNVQKHSVVTHLQKFGYFEIEDIYKDLYEDEQGIDTMMERKS